MKISYGSNGSNFSYEFNSDEHDFIYNAVLKHSVLEIKKIERRIQKIQNNPKNEGQATYRQAISDLRFEIACIQEIVKDFKP